MTCSCGAPATVEVVLIDCLVDGCPFDVLRLCRDCAYSRIDPLGSLASGVTPGIARDGREARQ